MKKNENKAFPCKKKKEQKQKRFHFDLKKRGTKLLNKKSKYL